MAYRTFVDENGCYWQAWESRPGGVERRRKDRRVSVLPFSGPDRRSSTDRRVRNARRSLLDGELANGWLTFESLREKRRLAPIPHDWETTSVPQLCEFCRRAVRVGRIEEDSSAA